MSSLLADLHEKKNLIDALCNEFGARRIRVFGSVARGEEKPDSDVDFPEGTTYLINAFP